MALTEEVIRGTAEYFEDDNGVPQKYILEFSRAIEAAAIEKFLNGSGQYLTNDATREATIAAATAPLLARIAELETCLLQAQNAAIDLARQIRKEHEPGPVNLWDGTPAKYGIAPADKPFTERWICLGCLSSIKDVHTASCPEAARLKGTT